MLAPVVRAFASSAAAPLWVPVLVGVVAGSALQLQQGALWSPSAYLGMGTLALVLLGVLWRWPVVRGRWRALLAWALAGLAVFALCGLRAAHFAASALDPALEGQDIAIEAVVNGLPQPIDIGVRFRVRVQSAQSRGQDVRVPSQLDLTWYGAQGPDASDAAPRTPHAGERWRMVVRLKAPHGARNPHGFDYELHQWEQGVQAVGYVRTGRHDTAPERLGRTWRYPVLQWREQVRDAVLAHLGAAAQSPQGLRAAGVVAALVTGDQQAIDRADWNVFRATGVAHLVSISGLHITLFAWLAAQAVGLLWRRMPRLCLWLPAQSAALLGGFLLAALYALFSGWGVPAQRTVLMLAVVMLLRWSGRRWPWPHVWLLACATVVLLDPWALLQAGFWLSFVAVGVLFATNNIAINTYQLSGKTRFLSIFREQAVVTIALAPLTLLLFGQVSVVGLVANLLAVPWVTLVVTPLALAGVLWAPLWQGAAWAVQALAWVLGWFAALPWAQWDTATAPAWVGVAALVGGVLLVVRWPWALRWVGVPLCLPLLLWQPMRPAHGSFELLAADVGQGNAVLVRTARHAMLYDAGPRYGLSSDAGERVLAPLLRSLGVRLDLLMLSHRDSDHTGGAATVLAQQPQAALTGSIAGAYDVTTLRVFTPCVAGQAWVWDGVAFELLHPHEPAPEQLARGDKSNAHSCVLRVQAAGGARALLAGDIERAQEQALVQRDTDLAADVLLVPHHGSKTSSSDLFVAAVRPRIALVQAAYRSRFGHPAPAVVQRLQGQGARVVDSARCGAARWHSDAPAAVHCEREEGVRYWQHLVP